MRTLSFSLIFLVHSLALASRHQELPEHASWTYVGFGNVIGDYYVTHHAWPLTRQQLEAHSFQMAAKERSGAAELKAGMKKLWKRFTRIELKPQGKDLLVIAHFRADEGEFDYDALYHPGRTADEILQAITRK